MPYLAVLVIFSGCASLTKPPPSAEEFDAVLAESRALLDERLPRSALARLDSVILPADPSRRTAWRRQRVAALFAAERLGDAVAECQLLADESPDDPGWRPGCWEARIEAATDRAVAEALVATEIDALLAEGRDFDRLRVAYRGHVMRHDRGARLALLDELAALSVTPGESRFVTGNLVEELLGARDYPEATRLARMLLARAPDARLADVVVRRMVADVDFPDSAAVLDQLGLSGDPAPSWRIALALAEWQLDRGGDPGESAALLGIAAATAGPDSLEPAPSGLGPAARAFLWGHAGTRLALARARLATQLGDPQEALRLLDGAPPSDPPSAAVARLRGDLAVTAGDVHAAIAHYAEALARGPEPTAADALEGLLATRHGYHATARDWFLARDGGPAFDDTTVAAGLEGIAAQRVAWGDVDGDGAPDLLLDGRLLLNDGALRFAATALPKGPDASGGLIADVDNDGDGDLLLTGRNGGRLLFNDGTAGWRHGDLPGSGARTEAAAFADVDGDGDLDLYLANGERGGVRRGLCEFDRLLLNDGQGVFEDATTAAGTVTEMPLCGRGVTFADVDDDGDADIVVGNYRLHPNLLWLNRGDGTFAEAGAAWGVRGTNKAGAFGHTIGVAAGDLDGDGRDDIAIANLAHPRYIEYSDLSRLLLTSAGAPPPLVDRRAAAGIHYEESSSDVALADVDNDGDLDLFITAIYPGHNARLYVNDGSGRFEDITWRAGARVANGWGAAFADGDGDGDLDLLVASGDGVRLLRNRGGGRWLDVAVDDRSGCNRHGIGSRVTVTAGDLVQVRSVRIGRGTGSQDAAPLHFGLGAWTGPVTVEVVTACGRRAAASVPAPDRVVTVRIEE